MWPSTRTPRPNPSVPGSPRRATGPPRRAVHQPPLPLAALSLRRLLLLRRRSLAAPSSKPYSFSLASDIPCGGDMARSHDDGREATKALRGEEGRRDTGPRKKDKKRKRRSAKAPLPPPPPPAPAPSQEHRADDGLDYARAIIAQRVREVVALNAKSPPAAELFERLTGERDHSIEDTFGDSDDGSTESSKARKIALLVSKSIASLSSYAGGKRIRVCSGFVTCPTDNTGASMILTSATLVRSLNGDNSVINDVTVKVILSDGHITNGHIFLVDFHYNVAVVKVAAHLALLEVANLKGSTHNGPVLAIGREFEGCNLMCSRGQLQDKTSTFDCSELLVSSCNISMVGSGGPLVNYNGQVLGINFYEKNQTSYLPMMIVSRILEQHQNFGKAVSPWLGLKYTSLQTMPLRVMERIYQKLDVDQGLYISHVAEGSPADVAGLCNGDILVECNGEVLSGAPEFSAMLLDTCKEAFEDCSGGRMTVEVLIKRQKDGSTVSKSIAAEILKEFHYNRWPAPLPSYKVRVINIGV